MNELEDDFIDETFEPEPEPAASKVGKSVEIPPPCDMDYYASTSGKRANWQGMRTRYTAFFFQE